MLIKTILNKCYKFKSFVYGNVSFITVKGIPAIEVGISPRKNGHAICSGCGKKASLYDQLNYRQFEHIPIKLSQDSFRH